MTQVVPFPQASQQPPVLNQGQQMNALQLFEASVPVATAQNNDRLKALLGDLGGASGPDKISIKGGKFRKIVGGVETYVHDRFFLDVVILGAVPYVSRVFYKGKFVDGANTPPTCSSDNGVDSNAQVEERQSAKCADCVQNQKGSKTNNQGKAGVACGFRKQLAVMVWGDQEAKVFLLDIPAASIFGDGKPAQGQLSFQKYVQLLAQRGIDPLAIVTRLQFDMSTEYPALLFSPAINAEGTAIQFIPAEYQQAFLGLSESQAVKDICTVAAPGTVVQVGNAPALAAPVQQAALAAPQSSMVGQPGGVAYAPNAQPVVPSAVAVPAMPSVPQVQAQPQVQQPAIPAMPSASPNVPPMPAFPQVPQPAAVATAPVSQPVMPTVAASVTNAVAPAPAVASVPASPAFPAMPSAAPAPIPQAVAAAPAAPVVELAPIGAAEVESWLAGLSAPAAQ